MPIKPHRDWSGWLQQYVVHAGLRLHNGDPDEPHYELTHEEHTNGYFNSSFLMEDPSLLSEAVHDLTLKFKKAGLDPAKVDRVVGPAKGAITLASEMARVIARDSRFVRRSNPCLTAYTEKDDLGGMLFKRFKLRRGERVLLIEDVLTSGRSALGAAEAVIEAECTLLPFVLTLVNRSGHEKVGDAELKVISLLDYRLERWGAGDCPLCAKGSPLLSSPKLSLPRGIVNLLHAGE